MPADLENIAVGQSSSQFPRRAVLKNVKTTGQLPSLPMLVRLCAKAFKLSFSSTESRTSRCKSKGTRDQIANICWIIEEAREFQKNIHFCFIDYAKALNCVDHNKLWKIVRDGNTRKPYLSPEKPVCRSRSNS